MGPYPVGQPSRTCMPDIAAPRARLRATLLKSPIQATVRPDSAPHSCCMVSRSARAWHGWPRSDSRLTTGIVGRCGELVEQLVVEDPGPEEGVVAGQHAGDVGRRLPGRRCSTSVELKVTGWPPSRTTAVSAEWRVRRLGFSK